MNARSRKEETHVEEEDWRSHGYTHPLRDSHVRSKLTNDIHPMFSFELDERPLGTSNKARWGELTTEEYGLFGQPLRLASQWLQSAPSSDAICSVIDGDRYIPPGNPMHQGIPVYEFRRHSLSPSVAHERAGSALKQLGKYISFRTTDRDLVIGLTHEANGRTSPMIFQYPEGIAITPGPELRGLASITCINHSYLRTLRQLLLEPENNKFKIRKLYFQFALTICHEIIHEINFAVDTELLKRYIEMYKRYNETGARFGEVRFNEPFYEGQRVAELGFFWETEVFGGVCIQSMHKPNDPIFIAEWPSSWYLVSTYYIQKSQDQEFWDTVKLEHSQDLLALRIRKKVGIAHWLPPGDKDYDRSWDWKAPENAPKLIGKNLRRVLSDAADPSPCARLLNETVDESIERMTAESDFRDP